MKWIKHHPRQFAAYIGGALILSGVVMLIPKSPWTLITIGIAVLFFILVSICEEQSED